MHEVYYGVGCTEKQGSPYRRGLVEFLNKTPETDQRVENSD